MLSDVVLHKWIARLHFRKQTERILRREHPSYRCLDARRNSRILAHRLQYRRGHWLNICGLDGEHHVATGAKERTAEPELQPLP